MRVRTDFIQLTYLNVIVTFVQHRNSLIISSRQYQVRVAGRTIFLHRFLCVFGKSIFLRLVKISKMIMRFACIIAMCILLTETHKSDKYLKEEWQEFEEFLKWKNEKKLHENDAGEYKTKIRAIDYDQNTQKDYYQDMLNPPPTDETVLMARYVVNQADWAAIATISSRKDIETFPTVNLASFSDGPIGNGSGIPYMYLTPLDFIAKDLFKDHRASLLVTLAQGSYCMSKDWDPMDPRCSRLILTGKIKALKNTTVEHDYAQQIVFDRHPHLRGMPADHRFFFAKLKISGIALLDNFGGPKFIDIKDYLHPSMDLAKELQRFNKYNIPKKP